jgi:hypothetical protein
VDDDIGVGFVGGDDNDDISNWTKDI